MSYGYITLLQNLGLVSWPYTWHFTNACNSIMGGSGALFMASLDTHIYVHVPNQDKTQMHIIKKKWNKSLKRIQGGVKGSMMRWKVWPGGSSTQKYIEKRYKRERSEMWAFNDGRDNLQGASRDEAVGKWKSKHNEALLGRSTFKPISSGWWEECNLSSYAVLQR